MSENLGGNAKFAVNLDETPIAHSAGEFFNSSNTRMQVAGRDLNGFITITQDNFAEIIRAIAALERDVSDLRQQLAEKK